MKQTGEKSEAILCAFIVFVVLSTSLLINVLSSVIGNTIVIVSK